MKQTAIFGGTFNPPHLGHCEIVKQLAQHPDIERIFVMPVNLPPHKPAEVAPAADRLTMCRLAFSDISKVEIREDEMNIPGKSYTVDTLERLAKQDVMQPLLVIGADSLVTFESWYRYQDILHMADLMVYQRAGTLQNELQQATGRLRAQGGRVVLSEICPPDISSTAVRFYIKNNDSIGALVPAPVAEYIKTKKLYAGE